MKANIDNKNVGDWFTYDFHNDEYIQIVKNKVTHQVFFMFDCICEISYRFGQNWFKVRIIEGDNVNVNRCSAKIDEIIRYINADDSNINVKFNPILGVHEFYFVES